MERRPRLHQRPPRSRPEAPSKPVLRQDRNLPNPDRRCGRSRYSVAQLVFRWPVQVPVKERGLDRQGSRLHLDRRSSQHAARAGLKLRHHRHAPIFIGEWRYRTVIVSQIGAYRPSDRYQPSERLSAPPSRCAWSGRAEPLSGSSPSVTAVPRRPPTAYTVVAARCSASRHGVAHLLPQSRRVPTGCCSGCRSAGTKDPSPGTAACAARPGCTAPSPESPR